MRSVRDRRIHRILRYSVFIAHVRVLRRGGATLETAVIESIAYCIDNNYLTDYFTKTQKEEVFQMVSFKRDENVARRVWQEEAEERGTEKTLTASLRNLMKTLHLSLDKAMDALEVPHSEREKYAMLVKSRSA